MPWMDRVEATRIAAELLTDELVVCSTPMVSSYVRALAHRDRNFYLLNSMGMACSVGLGLALARPDRRVVIFDGDGAVLMNAGALTTTAAHWPTNLVHVVWNNASYEATGGQASHAAGRTDLCTLARGAGLEQCAVADTLDDFRQGFRSCLRDPGPWFLVANVQGRKEDVAGRVLRERPEAIKKRFLDAADAQ